MTLLQGHCQRGEAILCGQGLVGPGGEKEANDGVVVLLGCHVQRGEPVLRLHVDWSAIVDKDSNIRTLNSSAEAIYETTVLYENSFY